jgi:hypothetical protein
MKKQWGNTMDQPNEALIRFHRKFFSGTDVPIQSERVFYHLLEEVNKTKQGNDPDAELNNLKFEKRGS